MRDLDDPYLTAADRMVEELLPKWEGSNNVWRAGWALDTLLDYFIARGEDGSIIQNPLLPMSPTKQGDWWDDFAWVGIASLRAAEQGIFPSHRDELVKVAINAWAYMHGPGWSRTSTSSFPFTDLEGWKDFHPSKDRRIGAPNAWSKIRETWCECQPPKCEEGKRDCEHPSSDEVEQRKPRYSPGGVWNAPFRDSKSPTIAWADPDCPAEPEYLAPIQNTVTNGLYAILSLRLALAGGSGFFQEVFDRSQLDLEACEVAWRQQLSWFSSWLNDARDEESLALNLSPQRFLVRERVSTFHELNGRRPWDGAYCSRLAWTGDQGLLLGFLREVEGAGGGEAPPRGGSYHRQIISAVFERAYAPRRYSEDAPEAMFLLPWLRLDDAGKQIRPFTASPPGKDHGDYQTGNGVFMRYLLQAYRADPSVVEGYEHLVIDAAKLMTERGFGDFVHPAGSCDAYTPLSRSVDNRPANDMTPLVNRLAVLLMAHAMNSGAGG